MEERERQGEREGGRGREREGGDKNKGLIALRIHSRSFERYPAHDQNLYTG